MLQTLSRFLLGTLRGRLIVGVAVVHAVMMTLFIADLTARQRTMLLDRQTEDATALSLALATSAAGWIAADDVSGLQELVEVQRRYPEILFAILADQEGRVLADTDKSRLGKYLRDLPRDTQQTVLSRAPSLVDVAAPAMIGGRHVGWARVGIGQKIAHEKLAAITWSGVGYALAAILIGSAIAWFMGHRITRRLYAVQETIDAVRAGSRLARSPLAGDDEAAAMAREFNAMLDALAERDRELRDSEELHRLTLSSISDAVFMTDDSGAFKYICPNVDIIFGHSRSEVQAIGNIEKLLGGALPFPDHRAEELQNVERNIADKSGREHTLLVNVKRTAIAGATLLYTCRDITERKRAEEDVRKSERDLNEAQRIAHTGSWDWDAATDTITWSPEYYRIYGFDPAQRPPGYAEHLKAYTPESAALLDAAVKANLETGLAYEVDLELAQPQEPRRWVTARSETKRDAQGKVIGLRGTAQDITERKHAEEVIRKLNQELEQRVAERTAQLEAANKELEAFAYSVSHDLRAPLRHIDGYLGLLKEDVGASLDDEGRHFMAAIAKAARHMNALIEDLLSFSRMGRSEMVKTRVDLATLVREVIRDLEPETHDRVIDWNIAELPKVAGDRAMLRVVLANLISNALKFTQRRASARIEIGAQPGNGTEIVIFVRDNGAGFDMNRADKLFGVFQRLHGANEFEGTGIGLANVRRVITRHGGRTWAEGEVDAGATFYFSLPPAANHAD